jgi:hypothetical protein
MFDPEEILRGADIEVELAQIAFDLGRQKGRATVLKVELQTVNDSIKALEERKAALLQQKEAQLELKAAAARKQAFEARFAEDELRLLQSGDPIAIAFAEAIRGALSSPDTAKLFESELPINSIDESKEKIALRYKDSNTESAAAIFPISDGTYLIRYRIPSINERLAEIFEHYYADLEPYNKKTYLAIDAGYIYIKIDPQAEQVVVPMVVRNNGIQDTSCLSFDEDFNASVRYWNMVKVANRTKSSPTEVTFEYDEDDEPFNQEYFDKLVADLPALLRTAPIQPKK